MTFKAYLATAFCLVALFSTASANQITLSFSTSQYCQPYESCGPVFWVDGASSPGDHSEGWGIILQVTGPHGQSAPISGSLYFSTAPSYDAQGFGGLPWAAWGDSGAGGGFSIIGSVFGLGPGSTLLSGTFLWASWSVWDGMSGYTATFDSAIRAGYVNPVLLEGFGLQPNLGFVGSLSGEYFDMWDGNGSSVGIDLVPTPEPSAVVLASLFLLVSGLAYLRRLRTRNCG
ncbi:MAG: hypothetical protein ABSF14_17070 [Terriglobia bacterium]|jgi:hypothetical protein